jgi:hypothetical protein
MNDPAMSTCAKKLVALILGLAVALAVAASASAATTKKKYKHAKRIAAASTKATVQYRGTDKFRSGPLYYNGGEYLGDDPDPNIRFQLWRDLGARFGGEN